MNNISAIVFTLAVSATMASADFVFETGFGVGTTPPSNAIHGIASDGNLFYLGAINEGISVRQSNFDEIMLIPNPGPFGNIRGVAYDGMSGTLLAGNQTNGEIYRMSTDGTLIDTMDVMGNSQLNAVGVDGNSGDFFVGGFNGNIQRHSSTGALLSSFTFSETMTGLAVDDVNETIFIMSSHGDRVFEYGYDGTLIGSVITDGTPSPSDNGQGLFYDNTSGQLYITSQRGKLNIWSDSTRAIVPSPGVLALAGLSGLAATRRKR